MAQAKSAKPGRSALTRTLLTSELLDKATRLFAEKGYDSTTLADIAQALGMSRPALYNYVRSKEDLLTMLVEQVSEGTAEVLHELGSRKDLTAREKLANVVALLVRHRAVHPDQFRVLDQAETVLPEPVGTQHLAAKRKVAREITGVIESGIAAGEFRHVDPRTTTMCVLGMCNWVAWWFREGSDVDSVVATVTDLVDSMLAPGDANRNGATADTIDQIRALLDRLEQGR